MDSLKHTTLEFKNLLNHITPGFFALENPKTKKVIIFHSRNIFLTLALFTDKIKTGKSSSGIHISELHKLQFKFLEDPTDIETTEPVYYPATYTQEIQKRALQFYWQEYYLNEGYAFYSSYKPVTMIPHISITSDGWAQVKLVNKAYKGFRVGFYETFREAELFVAEVVKPCLLAGRVDLIFKSDS